MPAIKKIKNNDKHVEDKVNYFIDHFNHYIQYGGQEWHLELENQLSLIEKILFQLPHDSEYRLEYFDNYFAHEFFADMEFWSEYRSYQVIGPIVKEYQSYSSKDKLKKKELLSRLTFHKALECMVVELEDKMAQVLIDLLLRIFTCGKPLADHSHPENLKLLARLILSEGLFSGKAYGDLVEITNQVFNPMLEGFPYSAEVKKRQRKKYTPVNNLKTQISGFKSIMQKDPHTGIVIMKAYGGIRFPPNYEFTYNGVSFLGTGSAKIEKLKKTVKGEYALEFFKTNDCLYIASPLRWFSYYNIHQRMRVATFNQIEYVAVTLDRHLELDYTNNYLLATSQWKFNGCGSSSEPHVKTFMSEEVNKLKDNAFQILSKYRNSPASVHFLSFEPLLIKAHKYGFISFFWQYLEALLPKNPQQKKEVKYLVSTIILLNEKEIADLRIFQTMHHAFGFLNGGTDLLEVDYKELPKIRQQIA